MYKIRCKGCMEELQEGQETCPYCGYKVGTQPVEVFHLQPGTILANKYLVGKAVGYGGFGVTYIGYDTVLERRVAIKEYLPGEFATRVPGQEMVTIYEGEKHEQFDSGIDKFIDEAKRLGKFNQSEGIVHIYDSFFANATAYIVMEYIDGITLKEKINHEGKLSLEESLKIITPIINALKEVHKENILHRDIAPDNIMIGNDGKVSLIDFGASRFATTTYSKSLSVLIKAGYAPVEQYQSRGNQGTWSDVYSLAATFYTMLTGVAPQESIDRGEQDLVKPPSKMGAKVGKNMDNAIMNALNLKPENRTQTMEEFENELFSQKEVIRIFDAEKREDIGKWPRWVKATLGAVAVVVIAFLVLVATGVISVKQGTWGATTIDILVPNLINKTQSEAEEQTEKQGLVLYTKPGDYDDTVEYGRILYQNPASGSQAVEGDFVTVIFCLGPDKKDMVVLPDLTDYSKTAAISQVSELGLEYEVVEKESNVAAGLVCDMNPKAGTELKKGDKVQIYVSSGNGRNDGTSETNMDEEYEVEDLSGKDFETAKKELQEKGITLAKAGEEYSLYVRKAGGILSQSPAAGTKILPGQDRIITVVVSLGDEKAIPDQIVNTMQKAAEDRLKKEGFTNIKIVPKPDNSDAGMVIDINPKEKSICKLDKEITLTVSSGPNMSTMGQASGETLQQTSEPQWSDWVEALPNNVNETNYQINTKTQYSYRDKSFEESDNAGLESQGYTLEKTTPIYSDYGEWSNWTTDAKSENDLTDVDRETRYSYRDKVYKNNYSWGEWSEWQNEAVEATATRKVETREIPATYKTQYNYSKYTEYSNGNGWSGPSQGTWSGIYCGYYQERGWTDEPLAWVETQWNMGVPFDKYDGYWYNQSTRQVEATPAYTQYHYCDQKTTVTESWGDWTEYSSTVVSESDTREVRTQDYYRSRTRSLSYKYTYSKWSDWSGYSDQYVEKTDTRDVRTRMVYQYKAK